MSAQIMYLIFGISGVVVGFLIMYWLVCKATEYVIARRML
jgi:uncharacterized membrane protein YuzA (DUF378 family)